MKKATGLSTPISDNKGKGATPPSRATAPLAPLAGPSVAASLFGFAGAYWTNAAVR